LHRTSLNPGHVVSFLILIIAAGILGGAIGRARRQGTGSDREVQELRERVLRLEQSLDTMSADMERISDGQRFLTALLEDRGRTHAVIRPAAAAAPAAAATSAQGVPHPAPASAPGGSPTSGPSGADA
jgi:hypothetical protein